MTSEASLVEQRMPSTCTGDTESIDSVPGIEYGESRLAALPIAVEMVVDGGEGTKNSRSGNAPCLAWNI